MRNVAAVAFAYCAFAIHIFECVVKVNPPIVRSKCQKLPIRGVLDYSTRLSGITFDHFDHPPVLRVLHGAVSRVLLALHAG